MNNRRLLLKLLILFFIFVGCTRKDNSISAVDFGIRVPEEARAEVQQQSKNYTFEMSKDDFAEWLSDLSIYYEIMGRNPDERHDIHNGVIDHLNKGLLGKYLYGVTQLKGGSYQIAIFVEGISGTQVKVVLSIESLD